jgi:hypothetical protein
MALTIVWQQAAVTMTDGTEKILKRGDTLPEEGVSEFHRSVLTMVGAVRDLNAAVAVVQSAVEAEAVPDKPPAPAVLPPEIPPADVQTGSGTPAPTDSVPNKPSVADNKDAWERYAVARGYYTQAEAESLTKAKLVAGVSERENV